MTDPKVNLDPELVARARALAERRGDRLEDVIERRMREYIDDGDDSRAKLD